MRNTPVTAQELTEFLQDIIGNINDQTPKHRWATADWQKEVVAALPTLTSPAARDLIREIQHTAIDPESFEVKEVTGSEGYPCYGITVTLAGPDGNLLEVEKQFGSAPEIYTVSVGTRGFSDVTLHAAVQRMRDHLKILKEIL